MLPFSKLKNLPVFTKGGFKLGQIADIEIDLESQSILRYLVRRGIINRDTLLIHRGQVISLTAEKMTVGDAAIRESRVAAELEKTAAQPVSGISARQ